MNNIKKTNVLSDEVLLIIKRERFFNSIFDYPYDWSSKKQKTIFFIQENKMVDTQKNVIKQENNNAFLYLQVNNKYFVM